MSKNKIIGLIVVLFVMVGTLVFGSIFVSPLFQTGSAAEDQVTISSTSTAYDTETSDSDSQTTISINSSAQQSRELDKLLAERTRILKMPFAIVESRAISPLDAKPLYFPSFDSQPLTLAENYDWGGNIAISPKGDKIAYANYRDPYIFIYDVRTGETKTVQSTFRTTEEIHWSPTQEYLAIAEVGGIVDNYQVIEIATNKVLTKVDKASRLEWVGNKEILYNRSHTTVKYDTYLFTMYRQNIVTGKEMALTTPNNLVTYANCPAESETEGEYLFSRSLDGEYLYVTRCEYPDNVNMPSTILRTKKVEYKAINLFTYKITSLQNKPETPADKIERILGKEHIYAIPHSLHSDWYLYSPEGRTEGNNYYSELFITNINRVKATNMKVKELAGYRFSW